MIPPENIYAAKKILSDCCGRTRPDLRKLAVLLGIAQPPKVYRIGEVAIVPMSGIQDFSIYALAELGFSKDWKTFTTERPSEALSSALDTLAAPR